MIILNEDDDFRYEIVPIKKAIQDKLNIVGYYWSYDPETSSWIIPVAELKQEDYILPREPSPYFDRIKDKNPEAVDEKDFEESNYMEMFLDDIRK